MQSYGRMGGPHPVGYVPPQMGRMPPQMGRGPQVMPWRPGMPHPAAGVPPGYMGTMQPMGITRFPPAQMPPGRPAKGPPKREMDSLLEEIKAKQRLQEQKKEIMKNAEARAAAAEAEAAGVPGAEGSPPRVGAATVIAADPRAAAAAAALAGVPPGRGAVTAGGMSAGQSSPQAEVTVEAAGADSVQNSTRLFLRELPPSIREDTISQLFSRYGVVCSIEIVYAKDTGERTRGYVMMDARENAQRAKDALQDREVDGVPLWIEWAKGAAPKDGCRHVLVEPPVDKRKRRIIDRLAKYVAQEGHPFEQIVMERESPDGLGTSSMFAFLFRHDSPDNIYYRWRTFAFAQGDNFKVWRSEAFRMCEGGALWRPPLCEVASDRKRSTNFSSAPPAPARVATVAVAPASSLAKPAPRPGGGLQVGVPSTWTQADIEEERERQRLEERATQERQKRDRDKKGLAGGKRLSDADWDKLEQLLRGVTSSRSLILEAMVFCLDKSDWAIEITECITESLTIVETDMALKLSRLLIVSDILHNTCSSRPAAWAYRREFEKSLPDILEHMHISLLRQESRLAADKAREQVVRILHVWEDWGLFAPQYVRGLEAALIVGVRRLRSLAAKGDTSREPAWLEPKLADWRRQHFSQLEKMCRTRGLRCSTAHLEATKELSLEEARKEWLIDRLVTYELHWHEKEQARLAAAGTGAVPVSGARLPGSKSLDDLDGEAIECDIDGFPLDETELDGEPLDVSDMGDLLRVVEACRRPLEGCLGGSLGGGINGSGGASLTGTLLSQMPQPLAHTGAPSTASDEVVGVVYSGATEVAAQTLAPVQDSKAEPAPAPAPGAEEPARSAVEEERQREDAEDMLDIERPEDPVTLEVTADDEGAGAEAEALPLTEDAGSRIEHTVLRNIELEVMELRASLETQGLHRDAIEDICDEKRQRLIEEHEATLASPMRKDSDAEDLQDALAGSPAEAAEPEEKERERARESEREKEKEKKKQDEEKAKEVEDRSKEKDRDRERVKEKEAKEKDVKVKKARVKTVDRDKDKTRVQTASSAAARSRSRDRDRTKSRAMASVSRERKARSRSKERGKKDKGKERSRSRSRERVKKARR